MPVDGSGPAILPFDVSSLHRTLGPLVSLASLVACGSSSESTLFGHGSGGAPPGAGATAAAGAGGTTSSGGSFAVVGGAGGLGMGGSVVTQSGGASSSDSGTDTSRDGAGPGGVTGSGGSGGTPGGAWSRCMTDTDCTGGRVCTAAVQSAVVSGRPGGCVHRCVLGTAGCDAPPDVGTVTCTQLLVASFCTISCPNAGPCPAGMDCILGACFYSK
jgi:hypothetical protein